MSVGNLLRDVRMKKGLSQKETAKKLNMAASTLSRYENNSRVPAPGFWHTFAEIMEVDFDWLWDQVGHFSVADPTEQYGDQEPQQPWFKILPYQEWIGMTEDEIKSIKDIVEYTLLKRK